MPRKRYIDKLKEELEKEELEKEQSKIKDNELIDELTDEEKSFIEPEKIAAKELEKKRIKSLRNEITHKLRFEVLQRDNFTCQYCGRSPKVIPGLVLEVDHIVPLSAGGTNDLDNLVTACWECNEGKKDRQFKDVINNYNLNPQKILDLAATNDIIEFKKFLVAPENSEERNFLYDYNKRNNHLFCTQDCPTCVSSGNWYYIKCIETLHNKALVILEEEKNKNAIAQISSNPLSQNVQLIKNVENRGIQAIPIKDSEFDILKCDYCYAALRCPKYSIGSVCAFNFKGDKNGNFDFGDPITTLKILAEAQGERVLRGLFFEKIDGGALDKNVTNEIYVLLRLISDIQNLENPQSLASIDIRATGIGEGTGVISNLFKELGFGGKEVKAEVIKEEIEEAKTINKKDE